MINYMVRPDFTGMTRGTYVRTTFMTDGAALQGIGRRIMTACTAVMNLRIV
jgi:hypothetical protein